MHSVRIVEHDAFGWCKVLMKAKFSSKLERIHRGAFDHCYYLERITIPLKDGIISADDIFLGCGKLIYVNLVEGVELRETVAALHFEEWRNDMGAEIDSINQILLDAPRWGDEGEKTIAIRRWLRSVLDKIRHCKAEHQCILDEAVTPLEGTLPRDIVMNNVLSFLALPPHKFGVEDHEDAGDDGVDEEQDEKRELCVIL